MTTYYTEDHEWITIGITAHAAELLGEVVFVELKDAGDDFEKGDDIGVIESVKAASELYAPVTGAIVEANTAVVDAPNMLNEGPETSAWLYRISIADSSELGALMDAEAYRTSIA